MNKSYRQEIDGLRGLCIISVVLYHLQIPYFQGGFLGVDIFFLISGYLITKILLDRKEVGLEHFYEGRIRRILPPLLVYLFLTTILSSFFIKIVLFLKIIH